MRLLVVLIAALTVGAACNPQASSPSPPSASVTDTTRGETACIAVEEGFGPSGAVPVQAERVVENLEVPWGLAFLPEGDLLVTERPGRLRLVRDVMGDADLVAQPLATLDIGSTSEGGLLGIALHPDFTTNRWVYLYVTIASGRRTINRVERWTLAPDGESATLDRIIYDAIPAARFHNGGRLRFGPDGMLYVGTGDARDPSLSQDAMSPAGKLLRLTPDGAIPDDNPIPGSPAFLTGLRNTQGWDWPDSTDASTVWITDHGPSGEMGRRGHDETSLARAGDNLGWPTIYGCQDRPGMVTPLLTWTNAAPPGGASIYTGTTIPEWQGDLFIGTLGSQHLHRVSIQDGAVTTHEGYFAGGIDGFGRLRDVVMGPDGHLYVTTSNCDGRANCPPYGDLILRITR